MEFSLQCSLSSRNARWHFPCFDRNQCMCLWKKYHSFKVKGNNSEGIFKAKIRGSQVNNTSSWKAIMIMCFHKTYIILFNINGLFKNWKKCEDSLELFCVCLCLRFTWLVISHVDGNEFPWFWGVHRHVEGPRDSSRASWGVVDNFCQRVAAQSRTQGWEKFLWLQFQVKNHE